MEIRDVSQEVSRILGNVSQSDDEVESIHLAAVDGAHLPALLADPRAIVKGLGIPVSEESQIQLTVKNRAHRVAQVSALRLRITVIVVHYKNCDTDVFVIIRGIA
ncbi:hypothetical protein AYO38_05650 [bacterium SCGC AG-212-C10]|nr:hypothetical protein AYO38_05650 [bacterium SCGC AG-212-C10]